MMTDIAAPQGVHRITRMEYDKLSPRGKGYVTYMQAAWNADIPPCPFAEGSDERKAFAGGEFDAMLACQEAED